MTDWLDPEQVKADMRLLHDASLQPGVTRDYLRKSRVLEALAELPEPETECDMCGTGPVLHRLWRIARIICGKDATP